MKGLRADHLKNSQAKETKELVKGKLNPIVGVEELYVETRTYCQPSTSWEVLEMSMSYKSDLMKSNKEY